ncbi:VpsR-related response regulator [Photobacterium sp. GJ3]|uniref:VpsR-related response regulator n=1 Tax=Photobacterium sp. GJ3 TaxID=2829502 RepID=UPI0020121764|nr:VpsR-related response regulator [Photobacterium sp. GJ3]
MGMNVSKDIWHGELVLLGGHAIPWLHALEQVGWRCHHCHDLRAAEALLLATGPCLGVVDLSHDDFSLHAVASLVNRHKQVRWLALVRDEQLHIESVCQFIVSFCLDYFTSPIPEAQLLKTLGHQRGMLTLERRVWPELGQFSQQGLQGDTPVMKKLLQHVKRLASADMPVLILGEIGTGKEMVAEAIFQASTRAKGQFVTVNCSGMDASWHVNGAQDACCFELARDGVLFLNEVTSLSPERQQELLQWLQDGRFTKENGVVVRHEPRLIAATHYPLDSLVSEGNLNKELFYRLNVLSLTVPPLRERGDDLLKLAQALLHKYAREYNCGVKTFSEDARQAIATYHWPGNVQELIGRIKRSVLLTEQKNIEAEHLELPRQADDKQSLKKIREESERSALLSVLENNRGQITAAARELGVSRATMYRLLNKHDLIPPPRDLGQNS